jgi:hypothetical protein
MSKSIVLMLILVLLLSSIVMTRSVFAQSVPEFTLKFAAYPYDVPTIYGIDQYTGNNITIEEGFHARNETIIFTIEKQPYSNLFYNIRYKGHFGEVWTELYSYYEYSSGNLFPQSDSEYTVIYIPANYPFVNGAEMDFQVQAVRYKYVKVFVIDHPWYPELGGHYEDRFALSIASGWSKTQTLNFPLILPNVALLLPKNADFNTSDIQLDFVVDRPVFQIEYCLDGKANVTIVGNTTPTGLAEGCHNVTVYATDEVGNTGASETTYFNVEAEGEPSEPFQSLSIIASVIPVAIVLIGVSLLIYRIKRK